ncbi:MAG: ABC transporter substrate-binding protein [Clostridia bacterium]|nr:ABC transporter substrate-binding protein [Clostridia bacterium]
MAKKIFSVLTAAIILILAFAGCNRNPVTDTSGINSSNSANQEGNSVKEIRYLNFKPEIAEVYDRISAAYEKETGIRLVVETAASGTYESTLAARMATSDAPTIFQINGPIGYTSWSEYCADLKDTELYKHLNDKNLAIALNGGVYGIPYVVEGYGIIYNQKILDAYFALPEKSTDYTSADEITSFAALKAVVEDMQKNKEKLGIDGVFASTSLKTGEDWRWQTHLMNIPLTFEFIDKSIDFTDEKYKEIDFTYSDNFKNIFDLYINNSTTDKKQLGTVDVTASMAEFALGKCAMVQNGNWGASQILNVTGNKVSADNIKFLPIYMGIDGEESTGICIGTENFICINAKASTAEQKTAADFLFWLFSSEEGKKFVTDELGFISPFDTFESGESPDDPLAREVVRWMNKDGVTNIPWNFTIFPSVHYKDHLGASLLKYAQGTMSWSEVKKQAVEEWKSEFGA